MATDKFTADLLKIMKKHQPPTVEGAYDLCYSLAGALIGIANGVDAANDSPFCAQEEWRAARAKFMRGAIYLLASSTPEIDKLDLNMESCLDSLLPLLVEKCFFEQTGRTEEGTARLASTGVSYLLKVAVGLWMTTAYSVARPDMNAEQLEAKGQDIMDQLIAVFTKQKVGK